MFGHFYTISVSNVQMEMDRQTDRQTTDIEIKNKL